MKFKLYRGRRTAFLSGDRKFMFKLVYPVFCGMMSQKTAVVVLAVPYPVCLFLFTMGLPVPVLYVMIFLIGITKGMITIINNHAIRQVTGSSNQYLNLLHMWYAVGAFLSRSLRCFSWGRV